MKSKRSNNDCLSVSEPISFTLSQADYALLSDSERKKWIPVKTKYEKIPMWSIVSLSIAAICCILYAVVSLSESFADFFNRYVSSVFRFLFAQITNILPFSIAEALIISIPIILFLSITYLWRYRCNTRRSTIVSLICIFSIASMFISSFVLTFAAGYKGTSLEKKLGIKAEAIDVNDLYKSAAYLTDKINELEDEIEFLDNGFSKMPYNLKDMNDKLTEAYDSFCLKYSFINNFNSRLKPVMLSEAMSYAHITGIYTFFTGEANLNVNFPDYTIPYTAAHELAHQRGIAKEDEANMIAFLVSLESDDTYIRYSAYVNVYEYVMNALYRANKDMYREISAKLEKNVYNEQIAYASFFKKYKKSVTSQVSGTINNIYLQSQGTAGRKSYGMVVDLTVAYLKSKEYISS